MNGPLEIYNSLTRKKEEFQPLNAPNVGMYICGPTVYGDAHLGHARPAVTFDVVYRYLQHRGNKVRFVRNITDVGHLENDADEGEDKIAKKARVEQLEPMEIAQYYSDRYHENMAQLNTLKPSIEPRATGHIIEQIEMIKRIMDSGYAYQENGSVYFDVEKYNEDYKYGELSGRVLEDLKSNTRELAGQAEKHSNVDFALWKKASPEHIMQWPSPWSDGFPGWHLECSAMSTKYLGEQFDIHGGGMDLLFPHHECEIAQSQASNKTQPAKYWLHNNMITINGQKMGKSLGNFITLNELFSGDHKLLKKAYTPMTVRFFILQAHYRSTLDFSNEALLAAEKGYKRLTEAMDLLDELKTSEESSVDVKSLEEKCYKALNDDFNTPVAIATLFDGVKIINSIAAGKEKISKKDLQSLKQHFHVFYFDILGLQPDENTATGQDDRLDEVMQLVLELRSRARKEKDFDTADKIRDELKKLHIVVKDSKDGATWTVEE